jgi:hypothetical protein
LFAFLSSSGLMRFLHSPNGAPNHRSRVVGARYPYPDRGTRQGLPAWRAGASLLQVSRSTQSAGCVARQAGPRPGCAVTSPNIRTRKS